MKFNCEWEIVPHVAYTVDDNENGQTIVYESDDFNEYRELYGDKPFEICFDIIETDTGERVDWAEDYWFYTVKEAINACIKHENEIMDEFFNLIK